MDVWLWDWGSKKIGVFVFGWLWIHRLLSLIPTPPPSRSAFPPHWLLSWSPRSSSRSSSPDALGTPSGSSMPTSRTTPRPDLTNWTGIDTTLDLGGCFFLCFFLDLELCSCSWSQGLIFFFFFFKFHYRFVTYWWVCLGSWLCFRRGGWWVVMSLRFFC